MGAFAVVFTRPSARYEASMKVFHYAGCSTCKKARQWLQSQALEVELVDIVAQPPTVAQLRRAMKLGDLPIRKLFNTSGQSYRQGDFKARLPTMSESEALAALAADGKLVKRPLVLGDDVALVGFKPEAWDAALT